MLYARRRVVVLLGVLCLALAGPLIEPLAADDAEKSGEPVAAEPAGGAAASNDSAEPFREQTIYVPYDKLRQTFEKDGRGVFIPYEQFQQLWKAAREQQAKTPDLKPPSPAVVTEADSEATVGKEVVRVVAKLKIDLLASGWIEVPLRLDDAGVISATLTGSDGVEEPARLAIDASGYKLVIENKTKAPRHVDLRLEYAKAFNKAPGRNDVSFAAPQAPVNRWKVRIPESGVKVRLEPFIAATQSAAGDKIEPKAADNAAPKAGDKKPPADGANVAPPKANDPKANDPKANNPKAKAPEETVLLAFVGAAPTVRIEWTAKAEGASGLAAIANVEAQQEVRIEEGATRTHVRLTYTISRAELPQITLEAPADQKVVNVSSPNVRQWSVESTGPTQKITVQLFEPARQTETIDVDLEQYAAQVEPDKAADKAADKPADKAADKVADEAADKAADQPDAAKPDAAKPANEPKRFTVNVPVVKALDVARQAGIVVVDVAAGLQAEAQTPTGLSQLDAADLPQDLAKRKHDLAYRYAALPFSLALDVIKVKPRVLADELVEAYLEPERLTLRLQALYTIERAGIFELAFDVPKGYEVRDVRGEAIGDAQPVQVDSHHREGDDKTRLVVNLSRQALGRVGLLIELQKTLDDPNLLGPTGKESDLSLAAPRTATDTIERVTGRLAVFAPESLRVNPGKQAGLRSVSLAEATTGAIAASANPPAAMRRVSSFVYSKAPVELSLLVERRKPYVSIGQLLVASVDPGVVKYEATLFYDVRYSGIKGLRIDVPAELAADIRIKTSGVTEQTLAPPPADLSPNCVAWMLTGESELTGSGSIKLAWERRLENLEVGKSVELAIPRLRQMEVDRAWGQVVLVKSETIDVSAAGKPTGLRSIDPQHDLMPGASVPDAALAFEFQDDWTLSIAATRYQLEAVKHTSLERGLIRAVYTRGGQMAVQALYRIRSARQRLALTLPSGVEFDAEPLRINGVAVKLENGSKDDYFVPLVGHGDNGPFLLELRYTLAKSGVEVELPTFGDEPAVQKVIVSVFLPEDIDLLGSSGPWTDEQIWNHSSIWRPIPVARYTNASLVQWVCEGVPIAGNPAGTFPVDGQMHVFSTLRPESGAAGMLRLSTVNDKWLHFWVFAGVLVVGVALVRRPLAQRSMALSALVIGLLMVGVFLPTLSLQIMTGGLWLAMAMVALVWMGWYQLERSRRPVVTAAPSASAATGASMATGAPVATGAPAAASAPVADSPPPHVDVAPPPNEDSPNEDSSHVEQPPHKQPPHDENPGEGGQSHG